MLQRQGVHTHVTDGRNFLLLGQQRYDVVSMAVSSIWFAGAAALYNREFYQWVKQRLQPRGVRQQWLQLHRLPATELLAIVATLRAEFAFVWVYVIGGQGVLVASNDGTTEADAANLAALDGRAALTPLLALSGGSAAPVRDMRVLDPAALTRFVDSFGAPRDYWLSTDDNLRVGYATPRGNVEDTTRSFKRNLGLLHAAARP